MPEEVSRLARLVTLGGADLDTLEEKLYNAVITKDTNLKNTISSHDSKVHLRDLKLLQNTEERERSLIKLLDGWLVIRSSQEYNVMIKRIDYIISTWRVLEAMHQILESGENGLIQIIENFVYDVAKNFEDFTLLYFFWVHLILANTQKSIERAGVVDQDIIKVLTEMLVTNVCDNIYYDSGIGSANAALLRKNLPLSLYIGNISLFYAKVNSVITNELDLVRLKTYNALSQWYEGNRAKGLSDMASCCEYWLNLKSEKSHNALGPDVLMCLSLMIEEVTTENLAPAHEFLDIMCDRLIQNPNAIILPYIYYIYLNNVPSQEIADRKAAILEKYPLINTLRNEEFESAITSKDGEWKVRKSKFSEFMKTYESYDNSSLRSEVSHKIFSNNNVYPVSTKVQRELLDIELLQYMQNKEYDKAITTYLESAANKLVASDVVVMLLVKNMYDQNDLISLQKVRMSMPEFSAIANNIFTSEMKLTMKNIYTSWQDGRREIALEDALIQYQIMLESEKTIESETFKSTLFTVVRYINLFVEELCHDEQNAALDNVEKYARIALETHDNIELFSLLWETLFFSHKYSHHVLADELLMRNPKIANQLDFMKMLNKAVKYEEEHFLRELFNVSLKYELELALKSKVLSSLLTLYCETCDIKAAKACIQDSKRLEIPILEESKRLFNKFHINNGLISRVLAYFGSTTKN